MNSLKEAGRAILGGMQANNKTLTKTFTSKNIRSMNNNLEESKVTRESFNDLIRKKDQKEFINEANKIMRERMKNKGSSINSKSKLKSVVLKDTKEICLKNYLIDMLKEKRTDINLKEKNITKALRDSETRLDDDYKGFVDFVEETKKDQKNREEILSNMKANLEKLEKIYKIKFDDNKKYNEELEKTIKIICLLKSYGEFVHKVLGLQFGLKSLDEVDSREKNYEELAKVIVKDYNKMMNTERPTILEDDSLLITKFTQFEEKVIKILETKQIIDKEIKSLAKVYEEEFKELNRREQDRNIEASRLINEKHQVQLEIRTLKLHKNNEVEEHLNYISELGDEICGYKEKGRRKGIMEYLSFIKETLDTLGEKEKAINRYIKEIESIEGAGDQQIKVIVADRKKTNKRDKQLESKQQQDLVDYIKRRKAIERAERVVIKGKKVPPDYPFIKETKKNSNFKKGEENEDYQMLYYSDDENQ